MGESERRGAARIAQGRRLRKLQGARRKALTGRFKERMVITSGQKQAMEKTIHNPPLRATTVEGCEGHKGEAIQIERLRKILERHKAVDGLSVQKLR